MEVIKVLLISKEYLTKFIISGCNCLFTR